MREGVQHTLTLLLSDAARPLRFIVTGGVAGILQLGLLAALTHHGWEPILANAVAFLLAAQVNFALGSIFTWRDRRPGKWTVRTLLRRWVRFHGSIAGTALLNGGVFVATHTVLPTLVAAGLGIGAAAVVNFMVGDCLVFRG